MRETLQLELLPLGKTLRVPRGSPLQDVLFAEGVEFPCGGRGRCKGCRVKVLAGSLPITEDDTRLLGDETIGGWRLACRARPENDLTVEVAQWEALILSDDAPVAFNPKAGLGVAVDVGTTTLVAQLLDLGTGNVLAVRTALNDQARHGADVMSRIDFALANDGQQCLQDLIRKQIGQLIEALLVEQQPGAELKEIVLVGNTVMHHLFCDVPVGPLAHYPFEPERDGLMQFSAHELGWEKGNVRFLPCLGGFVGSDILAGILATGLHESDELVALIDLGTNGEMVIGNRDRMLCASTAAGPAFEGARIGMGMRAVTGAISEVHCENHQLSCRVLGNVPPRGICGSGLVDAIAVGLDRGSILPTGRLASGGSLPLAAPVALNQQDIRELQLAKGAIAAGMRLLLQHWGAQPEDVTRLFLAGAFGNYISRASARRIGLLQFPSEKVEPAGNSALRGAKIALLSSLKDPSFQAVREKIKHVSLSADEQFQEIFVEEMSFPDRGAPASAQARGAV